MNSRLDSPGVTRGARIALIVAVLIVLMIAVGAPARVPPVGAPPGASACEQGNSPGVITNLTLRKTSTFNGDTFNGVLATASLSWDGCQPSNLAPSDFILESQTGVVQCGELGPSMKLAATYGASAYPVVLEPGVSGPIVVAFPPSLEEQGFLMYVGLPARFASCP